MTDPLDHLAFDDLAETDAPEDRRDMLPRVKRKPALPKGHVRSPSFNPHRRWTTGRVEERPIVKQPVVPEWMKHPKRPPQRT